MTLSGTDLESYIDFQHQAEAYRYELAQTMNELQMKYNGSKISSSEGKVNVIDRKEWKAVKDFSYNYPTVGSALKNEWTAIIASLSWLILSFVTMNYWSKKASAL
jgi:ABC-2 type transport system permease protein